MSSAVLTIAHAAQAAFSAYNLYLAYVSITNLQTYEETSKKVAKYSNTAENQLYKTRTTQASGTIAVCFLPFQAYSIAFYAMCCLLNPRHLADWKHRFSSHFLVPSV